MNRCQCTYSWNNVTFRGGLLVAGLSRHPQRKSNRWVDLDFLYVVDDSSIYNVNSGDRVSASFGPRFLQITVTKIPAYLLEPVNFGVIFWKIRLFDLAEIFTACHRHVILRYQRWRSDFKSDNMRFRQRREGLKIFN